MALFKLRLPGRLGSNSPSADALSNTPAESVEVIRKRARHRLMGSVILVLGAVVGLPLLFDSQPRPVAIDTPIVIPDRNQVAPLVSPTAQSANPKPEAISQEVVMDAASPPQSSTGAAVTSGAAVAASTVVAANTPNAKNSVSNASALDPNEEMVTKTAKPEVKAETKVEQKADAKPDAKDSAKDSAKAKALLDGKETGKSADQAVRSVVQVGAFADIAKAKEARAKLESAGLKTYTQEVDTKDGKRTRVRVGPFATREEADKAAEKIRKLNLQATVLKL
jgi:DedD protein